MAVYRSLFRIYVVISTYTWCEKMGSQKAVKPVDSSEIQKSVTESAENLENP
jgi:hypothetical protein